MKKNKCPKCGKESLVTHIKCDHCGEQLLDDYVLNSAVSVLNTNNRKIDVDYFKKSTQRSQLFFAIFFILLGVILTFLVLEHISKNPNDYLLILYTLITITPIVIGTMLIKDYNLTREKQELLIEKKIIRPEDKQVKIEDTSLMNKINKSVNNVATIISVTIAISIIAFALWIILY